MPAIIRRPFASLAFCMVLVASVLSLASPAAASGPAEPLSLHSGMPFATGFAEDGALIEEWPLAEDALQSPTMSKLPAPSAAPQAYDWYLLPDGLLYRSYLAGPHEPRVSTLLFGDGDGGFFWDATLGARAGLLRYGTPEARDPRGWQWDVEGAVITRLNMQESQDVEAADYRVGTLLTRAEGRWAAKLGYFHISSHIGDEFLGRNPGYVRDNYVTESAILGVSFDQTDAVRLYGETVYAFHVAGKAEHWQFQTGAEYSPPATYTRRGAPFAAINLQMLEAVDFSPAMNVQTGWQWKSPQSGRSLRAGFTYFNGHSTQFQFLQTSEQQIGGGVWFDY
ncbi:MAG: DUF1207 domain-containing protein [Planctomycetaceae bacterium]